MVAAMDFEKEIKTAVRATIMEEINGLSIRAVIRERILEAGFTKEEIRKMILETVDSYFRSAMGGDVATRIKNNFDDKVEQFAKEEIKRITGAYAWHGSDKVKEAIVRQIEAEIKHGFEITVSIKSKEDANNG